MTTALMERPVTAPAVTEDQMQLVKQTVANGATDAELKLYLYDCQRQGVHPLDRLLHFTKRGNKYTPVTSIDLMRTRAADTGEYAGSDDATFTGTAKQEDWAASVTVYRMVQGQRCGFAATARWSEYKPDAGAHMWNRMPHTMLAKCAEALALRKGFPRQLAGMYAAEEMAQADRSETQGATPMLRVVKDTIESAGLPVASVTVIDAATGEQKPELPAGYYYIDGYSVSNGWHQAHVLKWDQQGGALKVSTKKAQVGALLGKFAQEGAAVWVDVTMKRGSSGEAYLNDIKTMHVHQVQQQPLPDTTDAMEASPF